jgi:hypothetical protein
MSLRKDLKVVDADVDDALIREVLDDLLEYVPRVFPCIALIEYRRGRLH